MIEFLVNELIDQGGECLIQTEDAAQMVTVEFFKLKLKVFIEGKSEGDPR